MATCSLHLLNLHVGGAVSISQISSPMALGKIYTACQIKITEVTDPGFTHPHQSSWKLSGLADLRPPLIMASFQIPATHGLIGRFLDEFQHPVQRIEAFKHIYRQWQIAGKGQECLQRATSTKDAGVR